MCGRSEGLVDSREWGPALGHAAGGLVVSGLVYQKSRVLGRCLHVILQ